MTACNSVTADDDGLHSEEIAHNTTDDCSVDAAHRRRSRPDAGVAESKTSVSETLDNDTEQQTNIKQQWWGLTSTGDTQITRMPTCAVCLDRLDPYAVGIPSLRSYPSDSSTDAASDTDHNNRALMANSNNRINDPWPDSTCRVCQALRSSSSSSSTAGHLECERCSVAHNLWVCVICGHVGCGR